MDYIIIDKTSKIPLYIQISDSIRHHINLGHLKHGEKLPTESSISGIFEVSVIVAKKAYDDLVKKGLVKRIRGKGSYVDTFKPIKVNLSSEILSIYEFMNGSERKLLSFEKVKDHHYAHPLLDLDPQDDVYVLKLVTVANQMPLFYQVIYLPAKFVPSFKKDYIKHLTIFEILGKKYHLNPKQLVQTYRPMNLTSDLAMMLDMKKNDPAYYIRSVFYNDNDEKLAFFVMYANPKLLELEVDVDGNSQNNHS